MDVKICNIDLDSNQKLSDDEIDNTAYVCHGDQACKKWILQTED